MNENSNFYFTTVTVGKRGQIVIPVKLRKELGIKSQQQMVVMFNSNKESFIVMKADTFIEKQENLKQFQNN